MMMITLTFLPAIYAAFRPNEDEMKWWEKGLRKLLCRPRINPYEKYAPPRDDPCLWWPTKILYTLFSPFTHLGSQVVVHYRHSCKKSYFLNLLY